MNREIKFRVWDKKRNRFLEQYGFNVGIPKDNIWYCLAKILSGEVYPFLIPQQFTGLKDKNGKEIYEGDVLEASGCAQPNKLQVVWADGTVKFDHILGFTLIRVDKIIQYGFSERFPTTKRIIGNIYENPELIIKF